MRMVVTKATGSRRGLRRAISMVAAAGLFTGVVVGVASAQSASAGMDAAGGDTGTRLVVPMMDPVKGKRLFVDKGCVLCHAVNKVGGRAGPPLDAPDGGRYVDLLDFMARMWRGSFAMIELQGMELGYQLDFTGPELGHIAAFLADSAEQERFAEEDVPDLIRDMFIREPYDVGDGLQVPGQQ